MAESQEQAQAKESVEASSGSLLDSIMEATETSKDSEAYQVQRTGLGLLMKELLGKPDTRIDRTIIDSMISAIDKKIGAQVDEIIHDEKFQKLESAWRGLKFVVEKTDFRENNKIVMLNCSKEQLQEDFENEMDIAKTGLYRQVYTAEYGQFGGKPYGAIIANYSFGAKAPDIALLQKCAAVSAMSCAPFIAAADTKFFGEKDLTTLPNLKDIKSILEGPQYTKWHSFRESDDSRWVGLTLPRFLLRSPYDPEANPVKSFDYSEKVSASHENYCWGNTSFAFATRLTDAFAKSRWCPNIVGPQGGGAVEDLPLHQYESMGEIETKIPTEVLISERREFELSEEGFIPLTFRKGSDNACFFSANSCQKAKVFADTPEGKDAQTNYKLGTRLPYIFVISRLSHYIKVIQRENIGRSLERADMQRELDTWIRQYVTEDDHASEAVRARRPLRAAQIKVEDIAGEPGWYKVDMRVRPHMKFEGAFFTLSLVGKIDKK